METYKRAREHGTIEVLAGNAKDRIEAIKQVVENKQYAKIDGCMADLFTASIVLQVYEALNSENQVKFANFKWPKMADIALKLTA